MFLKVMDAAVEKQNEATVLDLNNEPDLMKDGGIPEVARKRGMDLIPNRLCCPRLCCPLAQQAWPAFEAGKQVNAISLHPSEMMAGSIWVFAVRMRTWLAEFSISEIGIGGENVLAARDWPIRSGFRSVGRRQGVPRSGSEIALTNAEPMVH